MIAAERTGRRGFGLEIDPHYVDVAVRRWQAFTGKTAVLAETGQTFEEIAETRCAIGGVPVASATSGDSASRAEEERP